MYNIALDTCIWINLGNALYNDSTLDTLIKLVKDKNVRIILPTIVVEEWNKNKGTKIINSIKEITSNKVEKIKEFSKFVSTLKECNKSIDYIVSKKEEIIEARIEHAEKTIKKIDDLFNYETTIKIPISTEIKLKSVKWLLDKKAPGHKKSSMADTLIVLSVIDYIKNNKLTSNIFVTSNTRDFNSANKKEDIHEDLQPLFNDNSIEYFNNIGKALNKIKPESISCDTIKHIEDIDVYTCNVCGEKLYDGAYGAWLRSKFGGLTWQLRCSKCGNFYDTGEFWD